MPGYWRPPAATPRASSQSFRQHLVKAHIAQSGTLAWCLFNLLAEQVVTTWITPDPKKSSWACAALPCVMSTSMTRTSGWPTSPRTRLSEPGMGMKAVAPCVRRCLPRPTHAMLVTSIHV
jgi:hypothetical protein